MSIPAETKEFKKNFDVLKRVSETIRAQEDLDIDAIVPMVDEAIVAYANCKDRLAAVKKALGEKLPGADS